MGNLGTFLLLASFVVCAYAAVISVIGARRGSRRLIESGIGASYLVAALMACASAVIINAFMTDDFSIRYVAHESESLQPLVYKFTAYWGGLDGSILRSSSTRSATASSFPTWSRPSRPWRCSFST